MCPGMGLSALWHSSHSTPRRLSGSPTTFQERPTIDHVTAGRLILLLSELPDNRASSRLSSLGLNVRIAAFGARRRDDRHTVGNGRRRAGLNPGVNAGRRADDTGRRSARYRSTQRGRRDLLRRCRRSRWQRPGWCRRARWRAGRLCGRRTDRKRQGEQGHTGSGGVATSGKPGFIRVHVR